MLRRPATVLLLLLLAAGCTGDGEGRTATQPAASEASEVTPEDQTSRSSGGRATEPAAQASASDDSSTVTANPAAELKGKCIREPEAGEAGEELVADLRVVNTGNLGVVVRVSSRWPIGEDEGILRWSRVRVEQGESKRVDVSIPIDTETADGVRKALEKERRCRTRFRVTGAFGVPED